MNLEPNALQSELRDAARQSAREWLDPDAARNDREERFPDENLRRLARLGLFGINVPTTYGGREAGVVAYALAVRELAAGCAGTTVALMVTNMVAEAIVKFGDEQQRSRFLPPLLRGEHAAASFCLSEPGSGSDAASLRATAHRDGDHYVLDGTKAWITSGGHAGLYLVMARTSPDGGSRGISAFVIEAGTPGLLPGRPEDKLGLRGSVTTQLVLEGCRVPAENRLGAEGDGFKVAMGSLDGGRIGVAAQAASLKDRGLAHSREAAMAKVFCTEMANEVCHRALQVHGPEGYTAEHPVERHLRDARVTRIYEGTSEVQRIVIARESLKALA